MCGGMTRTTGACPYAEPAPGSETRACELVCGVGTPATRLAMVAAASIRAPRRRTGANDSLATAWAMGLVMLRLVATKGMAAELEAVPAIAFTVTVEASCALTAGGKAWLLDVPTTAVTEAPVWMVGTPA